MSGPEPQEDTAAGPSRGPGDPSDQPVRPRSRRVLWLVVALAAVGVLWLTATSLLGWNDVPTAAMTPTILPGERVLVHKMAYDLKIPFLDIPVAHRADPERGDVVVFWSPDGKRLAKRVVGLPGDVLEMRDNRLFVNGLQAHYERARPEDLQALGVEPPSKGTVVYETVEGERYPVLWISYAQMGSTFRPTEVPEDHYFVLGDNRNRSRDSRWFGPVSRDSITARMSAIVLSFDRDKSFSPRWDRFFLSLP